MFKINSVQKAVEDRIIVRAIEHEEESTLFRGKVTLLLVDDEDMVLGVGREMLEVLGYDVLTAKNGEEAVEIFKVHQKKIKMVILDMIMPEMGGGETYERIKEVDPGIKVLLTSGYDINGGAAEILGRGCNDFIQKPFDMNTLSRKLMEILC